MSNFEFSTMTPITGPSYGSGALKSFLEMSYLSSAQIPKISAFEFSTPNPPNGSLPRPLQARWGTEMSIFEISDPSLVSVPNIKKIREFLKKTDPYAQNFEPPRRRPRCPMKNRTRKNGSSSRPFLTPM